MKVSPSFKRRGAPSWSLFLATIVIGTLVVIVRQLPYTTTTNPGGIIAAPVIPHTIRSLRHREEACRVELLSSCDSPRKKQKDVFTDIYKNSKWGRDPQFTRERSGGGSALHGAYDTIWNLEQFMYNNNITSVADVPSGDLGWQFAIHDINSAKAYFGGDIAAHVAAENAVMMKDHLNKVFAFWDFVSCPIPQWKTTCDDTPRNFDMVIVRDVVQHLTLKDAMEGIKRVVEESGATYLFTTSFPSECRESECALTRNLRDDHQIFYENHLHCHPWNFPEPEVKFQSHITFSKIYGQDWFEADEGEIYRIDRLKPIVAQWPKDPCK